MSAGLIVAIGLVAMLYSSVGHAGATGYIAVMSLFDIPPAVIRPTALLLNVLVATIATAQFIRAGHFRGGLFWPLAAASIPAAAIGGGLHLPTTVFEALIGLALLVSAVRFGRGSISASTPDPALQPGSETAAEGKPTRLAPALLAAIGAGIGLLSGLTGVGGGVFLTPILLWFEAAPVRQVAAISAPFILVNSLAGLVGGMVAGRQLPSISPAVILAAILGGLVGSQLGAFRLRNATLRRLIAAVLVIAGIKLLWSVLATS
jgi:uncharacterized membrane protein YfcA